MRRHLLASVFASALALPVAARAQSIPYPAGIPPGGVLLQNATAAALPAQLLGFGMGFAQGALPPGAGLAATVGGTATQVQLDVHATWPDGSARWASETLLAPALAAGASTPLVNTIITGPAAGTPATGTLAWPRPVLSLRVNGSVIDVGAALAAATDAGWIRGPVANQRRVDLPVAGDPTGAMHLVVDMLCGSAQASCQFDAQLRRDLASVQPARGGTPQGALLAPLSVTVTGTFDGAAVPAQAVANQNQYQDWHFVVGQSPVNVRHDVAGLIAAGLVPAYDLGNPVAARPGSNYATEMSELGSPGFGAPLATNGLQTAMETTGGRPDIGITTAANAIWLRTGDARARRYALAQADADGSVPWNAWDPRLGRWINVTDMPGIWTDQRSVQGTGFQYLSNPVAQQSATMPWAIAISHMPNLAYIPALLTGSRWYHDLQASQAAGSFAWDYPAVRAAPGGNDATGDLIASSNYGGAEVRLIAWQFREIEEAVVLGAATDPMTAAFARQLADSWSNYAASARSWAATQGAVGVFVPGRYVPRIYPPWQQDYLAAVASQAARFGDPGAIAALPSVTSNLVASTVAQAGWDPRDGIVNEHPYLDASGTVYSSWAASEAAALSAGGNNHNGDDTYQGSPGDYASLRRMTLINELRLHPGEATAKAGLQGLLGDGNPYLDYGNTLENEDLALPPGIVPDRSWARGAAAASAYQATYAGPGSSAASRSLAASEAGGGSSGSRRTASPAAAAHAIEAPPGGSPPLAANAVIGHWQMAEGAGSTTADGSGNGLAGTLSGNTTWMRGANRPASPPALAFNDNTAADTLPRAAAIPTGSAFSIGARVLITDPVKGRAVQGDASGSYYGAPSLLVYGDIVFLATEGLGYPCKGPTVPLNVETRILVTFTPGTGCAFYLDGSQTGTVRTTASFAAQTAPVLGNGNNLTMPFAGGHLADVEIWNYALTPAAAEAVTGTMPGGSRRRGQTARVRHPAPHD